MANLDIGHFFAFYLIAVGIWKLFRWKKVLQTSEEFYKKIDSKNPNNEDALEYKNDDWIIDVIKLIDKGILYFAIPAIILGFCMLISIETDARLVYNAQLHNTTVIIMFIGIVLNCGVGGMHLNSLYWGFINIFKMNIIEYYEIQEFRPKHKWTDAPIRKHVSSDYNAEQLSNELKFIKIKVIISIIGKCIFYVSAIALCFI